MALLLGCESATDREERLARTYCSSCHQFPEPSLLDKAAWQQVMPEMAFRMGVDASRLSTLPEEDLFHVLRSLPPSSTVTADEWAAIERYFQRAAPDSLQQPATRVAQPLTQFVAERISLPHNRFPMLSLLQADTNQQHIFTSNRRNWLHRYNYLFKPLDSLRLGSPASMVRPDSTGTWILQMGIMDPNDQPKGSLVFLPHDGPSTTVIDSLKRPVYFELADFNNDRLQDIVVCAFGNYTGNLLVYENLGNQQYRQHVLSHLPGARKVVVRDVNEDGLPDLLALLTQGDEQVTLLINGGRFNFRINTLLRFPPVYGTSYFEVVDFNRDGHFDLLCTQGDNADYSITLKPYHGIRLFLNDGKNQFKEQWFEPLHGCSWAEARDFDRDGDMDVAAISFFPDFRKPEQSVVYLENDNGKMVPYATPLAREGRWLLMETADLDGDTDQDLLLGALDFNNGVPADLVNTWKEKPVSVLVLRNQTVR